MISSRAFAEADMEESSPSSRSVNTKWSQCSTEALIIVLICFFTLYSCFTSSETHNMKAVVDLSLPLNGYHVELATLKSTNSPFTSVPHNLDGIVTPEVMNYMSLDSIEHYQLATSNSKSRSVCCGWWNWIQRLILMCFCLMVGEGSLGTPPKDDKPRAVAEAVMEKSPKVFSKKGAQYSTKTMVIVLLCIFTLGSFLMISSSVWFVEDQNAVRMPIVEFTNVEGKKSQFLSLWAVFGGLSTIALLLLLGSFRQYCFRNRIDENTRKVFEEQVLVEIEERVERLAGPEPDETTLFKEEYFKLRPTATQKEMLEALGSLSKEDKEKWKAFCSAAVEEWSSEKAKMLDKEYAEMETEVEKRIEKHLNREYRNKYLIGLYGEAKFKKLYRRG